MLREWENSVKLFFQYHQIIIKFERSSLTHTPSHTFTLEIYESYNSFSAFDESVL